jgi:hypothetical protein
MMCPSCRNTELPTVKLVPAGLTEEILECRGCGAVWSVSHGMIELLRDPQADSFLARQSDAVEGSDCERQP